jgi:hypothetical protein
VPTRVFNSLGTIRVQFIGPDGAQLSLPAACTSLSGEDPYRSFGDESVLFRLPDLIALRDLIDGLMNRIVP